MNFFWTLLVLKLKQLYFSFSIRPEVYTQLSNCAITLRELSGCRKIRKWMSNFGLYGQSETDIDDKLLQKIRDKYYQEVSESPRESVNQISTELSSFLSFSRYKELSQGWRLCRHKPSLLFPTPWISIYGQQDIQMKIYMSDSDSLYIVPLLKPSQFRVKWLKH